MGFDVTGIDIAKGIVDYANKSFNLNAYYIDFTKFQTDEKWDIIIMGDVIEHVFDPAVMIKKASEMLKDNGVLWVSTPNYQSAFSEISGHKDPMRYEVSHINYFSRDSLFML